MLQFDQDDDDRTLLQNFVRKVGRLISDTIRAGKWELQDRKGPPDFHLHKDALQPARAALKQFDEQGHLQRMLDAISTSSDGALDSHGLRGPQLWLKLTVVKIREGVSRLFPRLRSLRGLIEAIDNLLGSIIDALNLDGAMKELKDAVLNATEDEEG